MIVVRNKIIPFGRYKIINLFGVLFSKTDNISIVDYNHEGIHTKQIKECAILGFVIISILCVIFNLSIFWLLLSYCTFYLLYGIEYYCIRLFHHKQNDAYHDVSFEEEAFNNQTDFDYINNRRCFAWIRYVKFKSN